MRAAILKNNWIFYPLVFCAWSVFILTRYAHFHYIGSPLPSVSKAMQINDAFYKKKVIDKSISELQASLEEEEESAERGHIEHNIGTAYYDQYKVSKSMAHLDSAQSYYVRSIETLPTVPRFYYNLGRIYTERRQHLNAKKYYEKTLELDSSHVLALHNLALLNFYELNNLDVARGLLTKALINRPNLPICHYVLGEISLKQKQYKEALEHFRQEINTNALFSKGKQRVPVSSNAMRYALSKSHLELAILYSTKFIDNKHAQANLHSYLRLEPDPNKRDAAVKEMKRYWVVKGK